MAVMAKAKPAQPVPRGRKYTVDTHPDRDKIIKAIISGERSLRNIAEQFGVSIACISGYLKGKLANQAAAVLSKEGDRHGRNLLDRIETIMVRMQKLYDACDEYLTDPENPERYDLGPKAWEIDIVYQASNKKTGKLYKKSASLQELLNRLETKTEALEIRFKHSDPRKLIIDTASVLSKQLELIGRIQGQLQEGGDTTVNVLVINQKKEQK
jgi:transposase